MSAIAALYNVPGNRQELDIWAFAHAAHHRDIIRRIVEFNGPLLTEYALDPIPTPPENWVYQHQAAHTDMDLVLGIAGSDLTDIDLSDKSTLSGWIYLHASEHYQAANILGIG